MNKNQQWPPFFIFLWKIHMNKECWMLQLRVQFEFTAYWQLSAWHHFKWTLIIFILRRSKKWCIAICTKHIEIHLIKKDTASYHKSIHSLEYLFLLLCDLHWRHALWAEILVKWFFEVLPDDQKHPSNTEDTGYVQQCISEGVIATSICSIVVFREHPCHCPDHNGVNGENVPHMFVQDRVF